MSGEAGDVATTRSVLESLWLPGCTYVTVATCKPTDRRAAALQTAATVKH